MHGPGEERLWYYPCERHSPWRRRWRRRSCFATAEIAPRRCRSSSRCDAGEQFAVGRGHHLQDGLTVLQNQPPTTPGAATRSAMRSTAFEIATPPPLWVTRTISRRSRHDVAGDRFSGVCSRHGSQGADDDRVASVRGRCGRAARRRRPRPSQATLMKVSVEENEYRHIESTHAGALGRRPQQEASPPLWRTGQARSRATRFGGRVNMRQTLSHSLRCNKKR